MKYYITTNRQGKNVTNGVLWEVFEYEDLENKNIGYCKEIAGDLCEPPEYKDTE